MKKLLVFAAVLSFCTTETYGLLGKIGNFLGTAATMSQQLNPNGMQYAGQTQFIPTTQQNVGNLFNNTASAVQQYGNQAQLGINGIQQKTGILLNNVATTAQQYGNQMQYNAGMMGTSVNSNTIIQILQNMYTQVAQIQNSYVTNSNIVTLTSKLGNTLLSCQQYPNQVLGQLPIICQYIVYIYSYLNQLGAGAQIEKLVDEFSDLCTCLM